MAFLSPVNFRCREEVRNAVLSRKLEIFFISPSIFIPVLENYLNNHAIYLVNSSSFSQLRALRLSRPASCQVESGSYSSLSFIFASRAEEEREKKISFSFVFRRWNRAGIRDLFLYLTEWIAFLIFRGTVVRSTFFVVIIVTHPVHGSCLWPNIELFCFMFRGFNQFVGQLFLWR